MRSIIKILLLPLALFGFVIGFIRFIMDMIWGTSTEAKNEIILFLADKTKPKKPSL